MESVEVGKGSPEAREHREKNRTTVISVLASLGLAVLKLVVGVLTGSLGLIAEAAHSGLDFVASVITFFSVRIARRPADESHPFGHERVENLSAGIQGTLLFGTAAWISYESIHRLFFEDVSVEPSVAAFVVMGMAIATDIWRSRMLLRVARKYRSRALEADALNFRADLLSSVVVVVGLAVVGLSQVFGWPEYFGKADALAAFLVALIIAYKSVELLFGAVNILLDRAPTELHGRVRDAALSVPGILDAPSVKLRESGSRNFAEVVVTVPRTTSAARAHELTEEVEEAVRADDEKTEVLVHVEPATDEAESATEAVRATALRLGMSTHHERVWRTDHHLEASLHLEVDPDLTLEEAHEQARSLGVIIREENSRVEKVTTHIEVKDPEPDELPDVTAEHADLAARIVGLTREADPEANAHEVRLYGGQGISAVVHCDFPASMSISDAHIRTEEIEQLLRERLPELVNVVIHAEPRQTPPETRSL